MSENTLYYMNQSFLSTVKNGDIAMYSHNFILGQTIVAANQPADINPYVCKDNEIKLWSCIYDLTNSQFQGVKEQLAFIVLRGDDEEVFFHMVLIRPRRMFFILFRNKKFQMRLFLQSSKNNIMKL